MAKITDPVLDYTAGATKVYAIGSDGNPGSPTTVVGTAYEGKSISPGASQTDYNVKVTGGMFIGTGGVTTAYSTTIKNNDGTNVLTVRLNALGGTNKTFTVPANSSITLPPFPVTNIYLTTGVGFAGAVDILLFGI